MLDSESQATVFRSEAVKKLWDRLPACQKASVVDRLEAYPTISLRGCEKMGLAPSNDRDFPAFFGCREVPVPIFSQPLRESSATLVERKATIKAAGPDRLDVPDRGLNQRGIDDAVRACHGPAIARTGRVPTLAVSTRPSRTFRGSFPGPLVQVVRRQVDHPERG